MRPTVAVHGEMWIMLMHNTASARLIGQISWAASRSSAGRTLPKFSPAIQATILARASASGSLG